MKRFFDKIRNILPFKNWGTFAYTHSFFKDYRPDTLSRTSTSHAAWLLYGLRHPESFESSAQFQALQTDQKARQDYLQMLTAWDAALGNPMQTRLAVEGDIAVQELIAINRALIAETVKAHIAPNRYALPATEKLTILKRVRSNRAVPPQAFVGNPSAFTQLMQLSAETPIGILFLLTAGSALFEWSLVTLTLSAISLIGIPHSILSHAAYGCMLLFACAKLPLWVFNAAVITRGLINNVSDDWDTVLNAPNDADALLLALMVPHSAAGVREGTYPRYENFSGWTPKEAMQWLLAKESTSVVLTDRIWEPGRTPVLVDIPEELCHNAQTVVAAPAINGDRREVNLADLVDTLEIKTPEAVRA